MNVGGDRRTSLVGSGESLPSPSTPSKDVSAQPGLSLSRQPIAGHSKLEHLAAVDQGDDKGALVARQLDLDALRSLATTSKTLEGILGAHVEKRERQEAFRAEREAELKQRFVAARTAFRDFEFGGETAVAHAQARAEIGEVQEAVDMLRWFVNAYKEGHAPPAVDRSAEIRRGSQVLIELLLHQQRDPEAAIREAEAVLRFDPSARWAYMHIADACLLQGKAEEARAAFQEGGIKDPFTLARIEWTAGNLGKFEEQLALAKTLVPHKFSAMRLAEVLAWQARAPAGGTASGDWEKERASYVHKALRQVEKAIDRNDRAVPRYLSSAFLESLADQPRWKTALWCMNRTPEQLAAIRKEFAAG